MTDDLKTMTIDGRVHTYLTNAFVDEAEGRIDEPKVAKIVNARNR
jgi:hypothetical protein